MSRLLEVENVYASGMQAPVSFALQAEQQVVLFGASGSGKSLLFKALADLIPHQGEVSLNRQPQQSLCPHDWRQQVMYFSAETAWWLDTAQAHFETLPTEQALQAVGLSLSHLTQPVSALSSGEKQRLALLRGLSFQPKVLLLDEISANLDQASSLKVEQAVRTYCEQQQAAMIWISHDETQQQRLAEPQNRWSIESLYQSSAEATA